MNKYYIYTGIAIIGILLYLRSRNKLPLINLSGLKTPLRTKLRLAYPPAPVDYPLSTDYTQ